ncbi:MAG: 3D domain-containing protein [Lachnospiraceae bacterium]|nr:3D domain-containing protein [Lachnospiraceae bacterium]
MTKRLRVLLMVIISLVICTGTVSAYNGDKKTVRVVDLNLDEKFSTSTETVGDLLTEIGITLKDEDYISKDLNDKLIADDCIEIRRAFPITLNIDGSPRMIYTSKQTVGEVLSDYKDNIGSNYTLKDITESTKTSSKMTINITTLKETIVTEMQEIPFETDIVETDSLLKGEERVILEGITGEATITIKKTYEGTELVSSEDISKVIVAQPVNKIIEKGTAVPVQKVDSIDGNQYKSALNVTATGYTPYDAGCSGITSTGTVAKRGSIAVDPSVIPYGTQLYIPGYGYGIAEDCGGAIKGNKIDLCYETKNEAFSWGRRNVTIYILG